MDKSKSFGLSSRAILQLALGFFFVVLGITGIIPQAGEGIFGLSKGRTTLEIIFGVFEVICGAFFLIDAIKRISRKTSVLITLVILCLWILRMVISEFVNGIDLNSTGIVFHPVFISWLLTVSIDLVVAASLWLMYKTE